MQNSEGFKRKISIFQVISSYLLVLMGLGGIILVLIELDQITDQNESLRKQNETLERTLRQSYRPLGVARHSWEDKGLIIIQYPEMDKKEKDKISFGVDLKLKNQGKGLLSYLGSLSFLTKNEIRFREMFLNGEISEVTFDGIYSYARRTPILPNEVYSTYTRCENVPFEKKYFLYVLFLYEDQDGNLYDTEHLELIPLLDPIPTDKGLKAKIDDNEPSYRKEIYNSYTNTEKQKLCSILKLLKHNLVDIICSKSDG